MLAVNMNDKLEDGRRRPFYMIDNDIIDKYGAQMGVYGIAVYNLLSRYANSKGERAFPSYQTIAKKLNIGRKKVIDTIKMLVDLELIHKEQRFDEAGDAASNTYTLADLSGGSIPQTPPSIPETPRSIPRTPQVVSHGHQGGIPQTPDQEVIKKNNSKKKEQPSLPTAKATVFPSKKSKPKEDPEVLARRRAILDAWLAESGYVNYNRPQANRGIVGLERAGCAPDECSGCFAWIKADPWWQEKEVYPQTILKKLDEYRRSLQRRSNTHGASNGNGKRPVPEGYVDLSTYESKFAAPVVKH